MRDVLGHLIFVARSFRRNPGFCAATLLTLALGIGANVAVFSVVDALLLRPLPFPDAGRLVLVDGAGRGPDRYRLDVAEWVKDMRAFSRVGLFTSGTLNLSGGDEPQHVRATEVSTGVLEAIGVQPAVGRLFRVEDNVKGAVPVAVLSDGLWRRCFGGDSSWVGRTAMVNGRPTVILGVMPPGFDFPDQADIWVPASLLDTPFVGGLRFQTLARLRPGVSVEAAEVEGEAAARLNMPNRPRNASFRVTPLQEALVGKTRPTLLLFLAAVVVVLLVGCANITNLVLARMTARRSEMAVRAALGAGRGVLASQVAVEVVSLSLAGGLLGLVVARLALGGLALVMAGDVPGVERIAVDGRAAGFGIGLSLVAALLVGLVPAGKLARADLHGLLKRGGGAGESGHRYLPRALVIAELAAALVLSAGAGLLAKSFLQLASLEPGFQAPNVLTLDVSLWNQEYRQVKQGAARRVAFYQRVFERLRETPGVVGAGAINDLPMRGRLAMRLPVVAEPGAGAAARVVCPYRVATAGYFSAMKIPILSGREFTAGDAGDAPPVAIVSRALAMVLWGRPDVVGRRVRIGDDPTQPLLDVAGVAGDVRSLGPEIDVAPEIYVAYGQEPTPFMSLAVRTQGDPTRFAEIIRDQVRAVDPAIPAYRVQAMEQTAASAIGRRRTLMLVMALFASCALALAAIGIYGVTSYLVGLRTREFGVQMALGARPGQVLVRVLRQQAADVAAAAAVGMAGAIALGGVARTFLVNVAPHDPLVLGAMCLVLALVGLLSALVPARRASRVDPVIALRAE